MIRWLFNLWALFYPYRTEWVEDIPENLDKNTVYIVGGREYPFYAAIVCPRRSCRQVVNLDVSADVRKKWRITEHPDGRVTLSPSVHVTGLVCRCHYWLRKGCIVWCEAPPIFVPETNRYDP